MQETIDTKEILISKDDLLNKLRAYTYTPDDENIRYKEIIKSELLKSPELLYALHNKDLESELFDENGNINRDEDGNPLGQWDDYYGPNGNIRPYLYYPSTETETRNFVCYTVNFDELPKYGKSIKKLSEVTFTILVHGQDGIDKLTGIPRHDLIASIIRQRFNWSSILGMQGKLISSRESITDNNYLTRSVIFQIEDTNGIVDTPYGGETYIRNNEYWK
mgnify:CR=1 FL=1